MGCTGSKQAEIDLRRSPSPLPGTANHVVALTSSTLGFLDRAIPESNGDEDRETPTTANMTPVDEPAETINTWELMKGLASPLPPPSPDTDHLVRRSFSFSTVETPIPPPTLKSPLGRRYGSPNSTLDVVSTMRKALEELSPQHPILTVRARITALQERIDAARIKAAAAKTNRKAAAGVVVVYFTSLRGVRKTYNDCCWVRDTVREYGVRVDERDVSMDRGFREELEGVVGGGGVAAPPLPRVFVGGRCLGGAEEVRRLHEAGELGEAFRGCEGGGVGGGLCDGCGDVRFVPCGRCSGSCKVYVEELEEDEEEVVVGGFRQCPECNENGVVRCPVCCWNGDSG